VKQTGAVLADWAIRKIESDYKEMCACSWSIGHLDSTKIRRRPVSVSTSLQQPRQWSGAHVHYRRIGYDLFPVPWERIERMAEVKEYNTTLLAEAEILHARTMTTDSVLPVFKQDLRRTYKTRTSCTTEPRSAQHVMEVYQETLFEEALPKVRENCCHICDLLSIAVACVNRRYFRHGRTNQIKALLSMNEVPVSFTDLYERIIRARTAEEQKSLCHDMIVSTGDSSNNVIEMLLEE